MFIDLPPPPPIPEVPFYSQFQDISLPYWRGKSCGVTDLAMLINYYLPDTTTADEILAKGITQKAYIENVGWTYKGLIEIAEEYNLEGNSYDWKKLSIVDASKKLKEFLENGPVIASVHYKFDPQNPIPHLVVVSGIDGDNLYYNDPALQNGGKMISVNKFLKAWKKRLVVIRPSQTIASVD